MFIWKMINTKSIYVLERQIRIDLSKIYDFFILLLLKKLSNIDYETHLYYLGMATKLYLKF